MSGTLLVQRNELRSQQTAMAALADAGQRVAVLTHALAMDGFDASTFGDVTICNLNNTDRINRIADWLIQSRRLTRVVALQEWMIGFAADVRQRWNMPGMQPQVAARFRDKVLMKSLVANAGVIVPRYQAVTTEADIAGFDWSSGAAVFKPRCGLGAKQVAVVHGAGEALARWAEHGNSSGFELEEFVSGRMFHVDSVVLDHTVVFDSVGEYLTRPLEFWPGGSQSSVTLEPGPLFDRLIGATHRVISALGLVHGVTHLEVFERPDGEIVFCEVAARPGGGGVDRVVLRAYGVDLVLAAVLAECGLPNQQLAKAAWRDAGVWGLIGMYPLPGRERTPDRSQLADLGVVEFKHSPHAGYAGGAPAHATDFSDTLIVHAPSREAFMDRYRGIQRAYKIRPGVFVT
jgi:hypothetical protein